MIEWLLGGYAIFVAVLTGVACFVALFGAKKARQEYGFKVLKLLWLSAAGGGGILMFAFKLHGLGLV